jgi:hypothetical protein
MSSNKADAAGNVIPLNTRQHLKAPVKPPKPQAPGNNGLDLTYASCKDALIDLIHVRDLLNSNDQDFASSLLSQFERNRSLTDKQWLCVISLARRGRKRIGMTMCPHCCGQGVIRNDLVPPGAA